MIFSSSVHMVSIYQPWFDLPPVGLWITSSCLQQLKWRHMSVTVSELIRDTTVFSTSSTKKIKYITLPLCGASNRHPTKSPAMQKALLCHNNTYDVWAVLRWWSAEWLVATTALSRNSWLSAPNMVPYQLGCLMFVAIQQIISNLIWLYRASPLHMWWIIECLFNIGALWVSNRCTVRLTLLFPRHCHQTQPIKMRINTMHRFYF